MTSFYSKDELSSIGFKSAGHDVLISREACIYSPHVISLGHHVRIDDFCILSGGAGIQIGNYVHISAYSALYGGGSISIGDYSGLSPRVTILSESDDFSGESMINPLVPKKYKPGYISGRVILREFVQVGANSTVMPGLTLHEGVVIGAHSFVNRSCDAWNIYVGVPVKKLRGRSRKVLELEAVFRHDRS